MVYLFEEGDASMRNLLGGKGANLAEMTKLGLPIPQGFTVTTEACKQYYTVQYVRLPDLLLDLQAARDNGNFPAVLKKYTKPVLLIIDEWLLLKLTEPEARNLFELIHKRRKRSSTIFCSQFREEEWYQQICGGESTLADAIMDRISYDSYKIDIESADPSKDISMREIYGLDPEKAR
jgi:DNA replication protein DnaC